MSAMTKPGPHGSCYRCGMALTWVEASDRSHKCSPHPLAEVKAFQKRERAKRKAVRAATNCANTDTATHAPTLFTVEQFVAREPAFTALALRNLIFKAEPRHGSKGNGLIECGAIIRLGRKVLIHEARFLSWVDAQMGERGHDA